MRIALTTSDYERSVKFYCDGLGIEPAQFWNNGQGRVQTIDQIGALLWTQRTLMMFKFFQEVNA